MTKSPIAQVSTEKVDELLNAGGVVEHGWQNFVEAYHVPPTGTPHDLLRQAFFLGATHFMMVYFGATIAGPDRQEKALELMHDELLAFAGEMAERQQATKQ